jgi:hypothetical protein
MSVYDSRIVRFLKRFRPVVVVLQNTQDEQQNMQASIIWPAMGELGRLN